MDGSNNAIVGTHQICKRLSTSTAEAEISPDLLSRHNMDHQSNKTLEQAFSGLNLSSGQPSPQTLEEYFPAMSMDVDSQPSNSCRREVYTFSCGCKYLSPCHCRCCPVFPKPPKWTDDLRVTTAKWTQCWPDCPRCQLLEPQIEMEFARQRCNDIIQFPGITEEDASWAHAEYARASQEFDRQAQIIATSLPDISEWETV